MVPPLSVSREWPFEPLPGVRKMEGPGRQATPRRLALIERPRSEGRVKVEDSVDGLTFVEASELISRLLNKGLPDASVAKGRSVPGVSRRTDFGTGARLGMAFKCVYRNWVTARHNIFRHKEVFAKEVLETYSLASGDERVRKDPLPEEKKIKQVSEEVDRWVEEDGLHGGLVVVRTNDPWYGMSEEEIEDRKEFIRCDLNRDFEVLFLIPI